MYKVEFKNLGRNNANFAVQSENEPDYDLMYGQAKRGLMSNDLSFADGKVFAGFRNVGEYTITEV